MMANSEKKSHSHDSHVDLVLDWLLRASIEKEKQKNEDPSTLSWGTIQQLNKTTWLLGIFQVVLIILFATLGGSEVTAQSRNHLTLLCFVRWDLIRLNIIEVGLQE